MPNVIGNPDKGVFTPGRLPQEPVMRLNPASDPRKMRRIIAEDPEWSLAIIPLLRDLCLQHIVKNFQNQRFGLIDSLTLQRSHPVVGDVNAVSHSAPQFHIAQIKPRIPVTPDHYFWKNK
ncbi:UNVERIFIED_CONTAM: hypothetical protein FKN15_046542 [Acipenser sinensis]